MTVDLREVYLRWPRFRVLADKIHKARLIPGPACDSCREIAWARLEPGQASKCARCDNNAIWAELYCHECRSKIAIQ